MRISNPHAVLGSSCFLEFADREGVYDRVCVCVCVKFLVTANKVPVHLSKGGVAPVPKHPGEGGLFFVLEHSGEGGVYSVS